MRKHDDDTPKDQVENGSEEEVERYIPEDEEDIPNRISLDEEDFDSQGLTGDINGMQEQLDQVTEHAKAANDKYLRTLADFENFRKRQREELERQKTTVKQSIVEKLIPIVDNFERSATHAEEEHSYEALVEGVNLILRQLHDLLAAEGVEAIDAEGQEFDPEFHEALMRVETDEVEENMVVEQIEKGYAINGKVIRPAKVTVAAAKE